MREITFEEMRSVSGGAGVSAETIGCAVGGALGSRGGALGSAAGCIAGAYIANNWGSGGGIRIGPAQALAILTMAR
ncbi:hypothetical protein ABE583_08855 [Stenotrophomonas sp. TWI143]|uniref:hypothetical protein n=1 Tax=Stenotrophomonas TaxID=40323 RepID=UPI0011B7A017|nr:hypothetical protein [Stenotrophomonas maltophilia]MBH1835146.1 hypothetical protein [Stenotrophomonas maltophilia]HDS1218544.1 hypothetical protein [Stenotrophomonas maltophilia]HDS1233436.1 hypothetical protein [Stenotrophomonas maltophilia]HEL5053098.1 hypothetical protein [Stenotrophomonas maltophilia]